MADAPQDPVVAATSEDTPITRDFPQSKRAWGYLLLQAFYTLAVAAVMWELVQLMMGAGNHWLHWLFLPIAIILVIGLCVLRNDRHWARPRRRLIHLIAQIRDGEAPIEELCDIGGGLAPLVPHIRQLLRDLRRQKSNVTELEREISQRVATRTNALERQLGTLQAQASRDALTGLYNRRIFDSFLESAIAQAMQAGTDASLLMIDVDNFKILNDTLGHAAGDELLRNIGQIIRSGVREKDAPFRIGGDEFVIILPAVASEAAHMLAKRLIDLVDGLAKPLRLSRPPRLSIGVASVSQFGADTTAQQLVHAADKQLYEMKSAHRQSQPFPLAKSA